MIMDMENLIVAVVYFELFYVVVIFVLNPVFSS